MSPVISQLYDFIGCFGLLFIKWLRQCTHSDWPRGVFAWEYVHMVGTSRCFASHVLITHAQNWKSFWVENATTLLYSPIPSSAETWKIFTIMLCQFFRLSWRFKREKNPCFGKCLFCKTRTDYACKTLCTKLRDW